MCPNHPETFPPPVCGNTVSVKPVPGAKRVRTEAGGPGDAGEADAVSSRVNMFTALTATLG